MVYLRKRLIVGFILGGALIVGGTLVTVANTRRVVSAHERELAWSGCGWFKVAQ